MSLISTALGTATGWFSGLGWVKYAIFAAAIAIPVGYGTWQVTHWANAQDLADADARTAVQHDLFLVDEGTIKTLNASIKARNDQIARDQADAAKRKAAAEQAQHEADARYAALMKKYGAVLNHKPTIKGDNALANALDAAQQGWIQ